MFSTLILSIRFAFALQICYSHTNVHVYRPLACKACAAASMYQAYLCQHMLYRWHSPSRGHGKSWPEREAYLSIKYVPETMGVV